MSAQFDDFFTPISNSKTEPKKEVAQETQFDEFFTPVEEVSRKRSLLSAFPKGVIKGAQNISLLPNLGPVPQKLGLKLTEKFLPTQEKLPEELLERGGKLGALLAGGEGSLPSKLLRGAAGALGGQAVKELGGGEIAQDIAELGALSLPDMAKSIPAKKAQERIVSFLRRKNFSENEIAPLLNKPEKLARFAKFASKGEKTNKLMRDVYQKFDNVYESIRGEGKNLPGLNSEQFSQFESDFNDKLDKIPKFFRRNIKEEIEDLLNSKMQFTDLMDFNQAINARIGAVQGGKAILGILKEPIGKAQKMISPELASDYKLANELYRKRIDVSKHLRTKEIDDLIDIGELGILAGGIADQNVGLLTKAMTITGARKLARELLINPRLQNISLRMLSAIKRNKLAEVRKLYEIFRNEAIKKDKDFDELLTKDLSVSHPKHSNNKSNR